MVRSSALGAWVSAALALTLCLAAPVVAQEVPTISAQGGAAAPAQENWVSRCAANARQGPLECLIEQRLLMANTGQLVAAVSVRTPGDGDGPVMGVQLPLGLYLPAGLTIDIDGASQQALELQTCDMNGCYASSPVSEALLTAMTRGQKLNLVFQGLNRQPVTVSSDLNGFTAAFQRIR